MSGPLLVVGDVLLDRELSGSAERLCPEAPVPIVDEPADRSSPGGAGLAAVLAAADGRDVVLVTALGEDAAGAEAAELLDERGVEVVDLGLDGPTPEKLRIRADGRLLARVDRGGGRPRAAAWADVELLSCAAAVLVSDYGCGLTADAIVRRAIRDATARRPVVWDPHPRGADPPPGVRLATPNGSEAERVCPIPRGPGMAFAAERASALRRRWQAQGVAVTLGEHGAVLSTGDAPELVVSPPCVVRGDSCGAGDRFAATAAGLLGDGALPAEAVEAAVRSATAFVACGGLTALPSLPELPAHDRLVEDVVADVRARGGTVVATGGCFDLLHAGHVRMLEAARRLGDCLVVCLNSDASVRRLKGRDRPLVPEEDRAAVLRALACVDGVVVFDEDTPEAVLERLRPHLFAKGADYAVDYLPEARALARWGGRPVVLPYLTGRSTTHLIEEAGVRAAAH